MQYMIYITLSTGIEVMESSKSRNARYHLKRRMAKSVYVYKGDDLVSCAIKLDDDLIVYGAVRRDKREK